MARMKRALLALLFAAAVAPACTQQAPAQPPPPPPAPGQVACTMPRPQVCTREYRPVCGTKRDGARQTYGNGCSACADATVVSHIPGPCN
jgi:hypothetical protein